MEFSKLLKKNSIYILKNEDSRLNLKTQCFIKDILEDATCTNIKYENLGHKNEALSQDDPYIKE